eukprot:3547700-Rhodomonas_salina.1
MQHIQLAKAFDWLTEVVMGKRERREMSQRVVQRMLHVQLAAAFDWFVECLQQLRGHRDRVDAAIERGASPVLSVFFEGWLDASNSVRINVNTWYHLVQKLLHKLKDRGSSKSHREQTRLKRQLESRNALLNSLSIAVAVKLDCPYEETMIDFDQLAAFNMLLKEDVCTSLAIGQTSVDVMCHQRGSVIAEVVISGWGGKDGQASRSAQALAEELVEQVNGKGGKFKKRPLGRLALNAEVHGYIEGPVCDAVMVSLSQTLELHHDDRKSRELQHESAVDELKQQLEDHASAKDHVEMSKSQLDVAVKEAKERHAD